MTLEIASNTDNTPMSGPWVLIEHEDVAFRWRWSCLKNKGVIDWEAHRIASRDELGAIYADERHTSSDEAFKDPQRQPIDGGHFLHGFTRFDGCSNFAQSRPDCMMHLCYTGILVEIAADIHALGKVFLEETQWGWE